MPLSRLKFSVALAAALAVAAVSFLWVRRRDVAGRGEKSPPVSGRAASGATEPSAAEQASKSSGARLEQAAVASERLRAAAAALGTHGNPEEAWEILAHLRAFLDKLPKHVAAAALIAFLDEGTDARTGLEFSVGRGGVLTGPTSLRVFLLDLLAALDPAAAGSYAARILQTASSPDEWAISMRDYARAYSTREGTAFLRNKAEEMIQNATWLENPSGGFLEAFDVFVHTRDTAATPLLAKLVRDQGRRTAAHAAYLALDRLVIAEPQEVFTQIEQQPDLFKGRELMQSNFLARADVRDAKQRSQVERYLLDAARTRAELEAFAGIYPNANYMISENLLTSTETPKHAELVARDRAALEVTDEWLADARFRRIRQHLEVMRSRLQTFVSQAGRPAP